MTFDNVSKTHFNFIDEVFSVTFSYLFCSCFSSLRLFCHLHSRRTGVSTKEEEEKTNTNWSVLFSFACASMRCAMCMWYEHKGLCIFRVRSFEWLFLAIHLRRGRQKAHIHPLASSSVLRFLCAVSFLFSFRAICGIVIILRTVLFEAFDPENSIQQKFKPWNNNSGTVTDIEGEEHDENLKETDPYTRPSRSRNILFSVAFHNPLRQTWSILQSNGWRGEKIPIFCTHSSVTYEVWVFSGRCKHVRETKKHFYLFLSFLPLHFHIFSYSYLDCWNVCWIRFTQKAFVEIDDTKSEEAM